MFVTNVVMLFLSVLVLLLSLYLNARTNHQVTETRDELDHKLSDHAYRLSLRHQQIVALFDGRISRLEDSRRALSDRIHELSDLVDLLNVDSANGYGLCSGVHGEDGNHDDAILTNSGTDDIGSDPFEKTWELHNGERDIATDWPLGI